MAECIDREALIKKLRIMPIPKQAGSANTWLDNCAAGVNAAIREVASFPAADVAPVVHGRWEPCFDDDGNWRRGYARCSNCGREYYASVIRHYECCCKCGAKMDGGADHEA